MTCTCTHSADDHCVEILTSRNPVRVGGFWIESELRKTRLGECSKCGCERYEEADDE
jgi:hypothetical protein